MGSREILFNDREKYSWIRELTKLKDQSIEIKGGIINALPTLDHLLPPTGTNVAKRVTAGN